MAWTLHPIQGSGPDVYAEAFTWGRDAVILLDEITFERCTPDEREDTIRHEIAHLLAWDLHGHEIEDHGPEFRRARIDLDMALES